VGEVGIDGSPQFANSLELQRRVFEAILDGCSKLGGKIVSIHSRRAANEVLECLEANPSAGSAVLHWFSGSKSELERAVRLGAWFSVGPAMLASSKGRQLVEAMPRSRVLTESDGPFAKIGMKSIGPNDMFKAERLLAEIWKVSEKESKSQIYENFKKLVGSPDR